MLQLLPPFLNSIPLSLQILLVALLSTILYLLTKHYINQRHQTRQAISRGCLPPYQWPTRDPIFGLDFLYDQYTALKKHDLLASMSRRFATAGVRTATLSPNIGIGGGKPIVATIEPENVKAVLGTEFGSWSLSAGRKKHLGAFLGRGIFTTDGEEWKRSREVLRPAFTRSRVGDVEGFERHVRRLVECVNMRGEEEGEGGKVVDLQPLFFAFTMDVATEFLFGESSDTLTRWGGGGARTVRWENAGSVVSAEEFVDAFSYCTVTMEVGEKDSAWGLLSLFLPNAKLKRAFKVVNKYVEGIVDKGIANHAYYKPDKSNYLFLQEVIAQTSDKTKIRAELLNILLAGRDTTASVLSNVWFWLSKRQDIWTRLQLEVAALDGALPTFEQLKELKYLNAILKESLRLYPVVPENNREATEDTILPVGGGDDEKSPIFIPKGWNLAWSLWTMHRRKDLYGEDAEEFKPERWLDDGEKKGLRVGWEYLPFNGGPRICIGQQFALTEACFVTVRLVQEFEGIESKDPEPWTEKIGMTLTSRNGAKVVLKPRT